MSATPWVKWFPGDFLNGVSDMAPNEGWAYVMVLNLIYDAQRPIKYDIARLARRCSMRPSTFSAAVDSLIEAEKLTLSDNHLSNRRAEKVIETRRKLVAKSSEAATSRWSKVGEEPEQKQQNGDAVASAMQCQTDAIPEARSQKLERVPPNPPRGKETKGLFETDFDDFWRAYPNKKAKPAAKAAFLKATKRADVAAIMRGLERAKVSRDWTKDDGQFVPHPSTWLNGDRWADDVGATVHPFLAPEPAQAFDPWPARARAWMADDGWNSVDWGPNPDQAGCRMPRRYIDEALASGVRWAPHLKMVAE